jgi:EPS-associated MarR family transcriptional regulator
MASRRAEQQESVRLRILELLNKDPHISTRALAKSVGISNGSAFYVMRALVKKGFVKLENFNKNPSKRRYVYLLTPGGIQEKAHLARRFVARKREEYEQLKAEIKTLEEEL